MDFEATVSALSAQGSGVVQTPSGKTYFVSGAWPGDRGRFSVKRVQGNFGEAVVTAPLSRSEERGEVSCGHHGPGPSHCGGCPWLGVSYGRQLEEKHRMVEKLLARYRIDATVAPVAASLSEWGYRNRVQIKTDGKVLGFVSPSNGALVPIRGCGVLEPELETQLKDAIGSLPREDWAPGEGHRWNFFEFETGTEWRNRPLNRRLPFRQGNSSQNDSLRAWVSAELSGETGPVLELFCGSGNFTTLSGGREWTAVEANGAGTVALEARKLPGVRVVRADCFHRPGWHRFLSSEQRVLLLDPPRQGFGGLGQMVRRMPGLRRIVYLSCQPSSWVRDVGPLLKRGWKVDRVQPLDLFPQTPHVELLTSLSFQKDKAVQETKCGSSTRGKPD